MFCSFHILEPYFLTLVSHPYRVGNVVRPTGDTASFTEDLGGGIDNTSSIPGSDEDNDDGWVTESDDQEDFDSDSG